MIGGMTDQLATSLATVNDLIELTGWSRETITRRVADGTIPVAHKGPGPKGHYVFAIDQLRPILLDRIAELRSERDRLDETITRAEEALR